MIKRRAVLKGAAITAAASTFDIVKAESVRGTKQNSMIEIGWIGLGGQGTRDAYLLEKTGKAKVTAIADYFQHRVDNARKPLTGDEKNWRPNPDNVDPKKVFVGVEGYKGLIESNVDAVLMVTPPGFRPDHFKAAIAAKKHVYAEKPLAVDVPGCHTVNDSGIIAKTNNLTVVVGLQRRYSKAYRACKKFIDEGGIGNIVMTHSAWDQGDLWKNRRAQRADYKGSNMDYEVEHWYYFKWLCGDHIVEQSIHNMDVIAWMLNAYPVKASGFGGRRIRKEIGEIYDHFSVMYEYDEPHILQSHTAVQIDGIRPDVSETIRGTKGTFTTSAGKGGTGDAVIQGIKKRGDTTAPILLQIPEDTVDKHYDQEAEAFVHSILGTADGEDKHRNDTSYGVKSTFMSILGRDAAYKRTTLSWDELWNSNKRLTFKT